MDAANRATVLRPSESIDFTEGRKINNLPIGELLFQGSQSQSFSIMNDGSKIIKAYYMGEEPSEELVNRLISANNPSLIKIYSSNIYSEHYCCVEKRYGDIPKMLSLSLANQLELIEKEAKAISAFHSLGYTINDIKLEHFKMDERDNVVLVDIGYAEKLGNSFNKQPSPFSAPELYSRQSSEESDYYSFGVAILEQFIPDLFSNMSRQQIIEFVNSSNLISKCTSIPTDIRIDVETLLSDNPKARKHCRWFDDNNESRNIQNLHRRTQASSNQSITQSLGELKRLIVIEVLALAHRANPKVFETKVVPIIKQLSFTSSANVQATLQYLQMLPRADRNTNYTNLNSNNINAFLAEPKLTTSLESHRARNNPYKYIKHLKLYKNIYVFDKEIVDSLDEAGSERSSLSEKRAWSALKIIGIVIGVLCAIAIAIIVIIGILILVAIAVGLCIVGFIIYLLSGG